MTDKPNTTAIKALCKAQAAMTGAMKAAENPHFRSKYADLGAVQDACFPALHANGFAVVQVLRQAEEGSFLDTTLLHESGESWTCPVPLIVGKQDMQGLGSAITYARRYGLLCVSGVAPEDDDGNKAAENKPRNQADRVGAKDAKPAGPTETDIITAMTTMQTMQSISDLQACWNGLGNALQHEQRVIDAKEDQKMAIMERPE